MSRSGRGPRRQDGISSAGKIANGRAEGPVYERVVRPAFEPRHPRRVPAAGGPGLSKLGVAVLLFGLLYDVVEHAMGQAAAAGQFSTGEHTAHLIALVGMVLVLAGVVAQGARAARQAKPHDP